MNGDISNGINNLPYGIFAFIFLIINLIGFYVARGKGRSGPLFVLLHFGIVAFLVLAALFVALVTVRNPTGDTSALWWNIAIAGSGLAGSITALVIAIAVSPKEAGGKRSFIMEYISDIGGYSADINASTRKNKSLDANTKTYQLVKDEGEFSAEDYAVRYDDAYTTCPYYLLKGINDLYMQHGYPEEITVFKAASNEYLDAILLFGDGFQNVLGGFAVGEDNIRSSSLFKLLNDSGANVSQEDIMRMKIPARFIRPA